MEYSHVVVILKQDNLLFYQIICIFVMTLRRNGVKARCQYIDNTESPIL